jgi:hypothetical protein
MEGIPYGSQVEVPLTGAQISRACAQMSVHTHLHALYPSHHNVKMNTTALLILSIWVVLGSNNGTEINYYDLSFHDFFQSFQGNSGTVIYKRQ